MFIAVAYGVRMVSSLSPQIQFLTMIQKIIRQCTYMLTIMLLLRFTLKYIGSNPNSMYTFFVYVFTEPFAAQILPFRYTPSTSNFIVVEWNTLVAAAFYIITASAVSKLLPNISMRVWSQRRKKTLYPQRIPVYTPTGYPQIAHS
jgi:hypothetical protein